MQWKVGWALWCRWSLIKCACGWKRNECLVFALCPPQAAAPPEALYIFPTLPSHTLWLRSIPQPASTSDLRAKRPSDIFLSLCFCSRGYFWRLNLLTLLYRTYVTIYWKMAARSSHPSPNDLSKQTFKEGICYQTKEIKNRPTVEVRHLVPFGDKGGKKEGRGQEIWCFYT